MEHADYTLAQILAAAGPRGATFLGRHIPQGSRPSLAQLLNRAPNEPVEGEGLGYGMVGAGAFGANMPARFRRPLTRVEQLRLYLAADELEKLQRKAKNVPTREWHKFTQQMNDLADEIQHLQGRN